MSETSSRPLIVRDDLPTVVADMAIQLHLADRNQGRTILAPFQYARAAYDLALAAALVSLPEERDILISEFGAVAGVHYPLPVSR
jgi:hypothetical protein